MKKNTIILAAGPNGLGVLRSLDLADIKCQIVTRTAGDVAHLSRLPVAKHTIVGKSDSEQYGWLLEFLTTQPSDTIVIPTSDWFVSFLTEYQEQLSQNCRFIIPDENLSDVLIDKAAETKTIGEIIPLPKTIQHIESKEQLLASIELPIIVKPRSHKHMVLGSKNIVINTDQELDAFFDKFSDVLTSVIAQEIIGGEDSNQWVCNCFFDQEGELTQAFTFNRLRLSPSHYGVTSYAVSQLNQDVIELSRKLGKALNYCGPAMIEFKKDPKDGVYKYIEINPRLGMCNYFDTSCGINNALLTHQMASGTFVKQEKQMVENVMFVSFYEDFFSRLRDGEKLFSILKEYTKNRLTKRHIFIYFTWRDPFPAIKLGLRQLSSLFKAVVKKIF